MFATGQIIGLLVVRKIGSCRIAGWNAFSWADAGTTIFLVAAAVSLGPIDRPGHLSAVH